MSRDDNLDFFWPPRGWKKLNFIKQLNGQAIVKDPRFATIEGACYQIQPIPITDNQHHKNLSYRIDINGWTYSIQNESQEFNILSFILRERPHKVSNKKEHYLLDIKTKSRPVLLSDRSAARAYMAAVFMVKQIVSNKVPDYERILRLYKIHPTQRDLYQIDCEREDSLNCGVIPYGRR